MPAFSDSPSAAVMPSSESESEAGAGAAAAAAAAGWRRGGEGQTGGTYEEYAPDSSQAGMTINFRDSA